MQKFMDIEVCLEAGMTDLLCNDRSLRNSLITVERGEFRSWDTKGANLIFKSIVEIFNI